MRNLLTGLDVGTSKVCALIGEALADGQLAVLGYGVAPCTGLRKGVVVNIEATVDSIKAAVEEAEKTSGARIGSVVVGVAGPHIRGLNSHGIVAVRGGEVGQRDVDRVIDAARAVAIPLDRQVLHILPQQFAVDEQEGVREPLGMAGVRLEARIHIVTAAQSYGLNLTKCCERAGVTPSEMVFQPLASADAALFPEERELGVALIDIGGGTTDIIVFHGGAVMHTAVLPIGGNHLTSDIAAGLRTPISDAERLKIAYGIATNLIVRRDEMILLKVGRHFRLSPQVKIIVARDQSENQFLSRFELPGWRFEALDCGSPITVVEGEPDEDLKILIASITARYSDRRHEALVEVAARRDGREERLLVPPVADQVLEGYRL